jgi:hypothetical protein
LIKPDKYTDLYRLRTAIFLFIYSAVALLDSWNIIRLFQVTETPRELIAIILLVIPRFAGYFYFSYCGLIDVKRLEARRRVFLLSMGAFASYLLLSGAITVYHYFLHPMHLVEAPNFNFAFEFAAKTRIGLSRLAFTLNSFVLAGIFVYNILRFQVKGFTQENHLRMMCSLLIAIGMANILIISFIFTPFVGFLAIFLALWTKEKGYKLAFLQAILLSISSAGIGSGVFLARDFFTPEGIQKVFALTMAACLVVGILALWGYIFSRKRFYAGLNAKHSKSNWGRA